MTDLRSLTITITDEVISDLKNRLALTRWPEQETVTDWTQGVPLAYQQSLMDYWANDYDHQRLANRLNAYENFVTEVNGLDIHFLHVRSEPRSCVTTTAQPRLARLYCGILKVIGPLTEPQAHGLDATQAFPPSNPHLCPVMGFPANLRKPV